MLNNRQNFSSGDFVVYPTHGVGRIKSIETQEVSGCELSLYVIEFEKERMTLKLPVAKAGLAGLRRLSSQKAMGQAMTTLKQPGKVKRALWSKRAQEYESKINSGDPISIAEVIRDLHRKNSMEEQSYSERQILKEAMDRLVSELAAINSMDPSEARKEIEKMLFAAA